MTTPQWIRWIPELRELIACYGLVILGFSLIFWPKGETPRQFPALCRWAALVWILSIVYFLSEVGGLYSRHVFVLGIFPAIGAFVLPEFVLYTMGFLYLRFGWPAILRKRYLAEERRRLECMLQETASVRVEREFTQLS